jgi:ribosome-binding protein aMBF1 (putative translation factor)
MGLVEQIRIAKEIAGWSTQQLLERSGLKLDRSTLHRKLAGDTPMTDAECQSLAHALGIQLIWPKAAG